MDAKRGRGRVYERSGGIKWMQYSLNGRKYRESCHTTDQDTAEKMLRDKMREVAAAQIGAKSFITPHANRLTIRELVENVRTDFRMRDKATVPNLCHLKKLDTDFGDRRATALTSEEITKYIERRKTAGHRPASINRTTQLLGQCYRLAVRTGLLNRVPFIPRLSEKGNERTGYFSAQEFETLVSNLPADLRDYTRFAYISGMRKGEISSLRWADVDGDTIKLRGENAKNGSARSIPCVAGELAAILKRRREAKLVSMNGQTEMSPWIFYRVVRGKVSRVAWFNKVWDKACAKADLQGRLFHDLRRTAVRNLLRSGTSPHTAMKISGHKSQSMLQRYDIISDVDVRDALARADEYREASQSNVVTMAGGR
jgi:integrase